MSYFGEGIPTWPGPMSDKDREYDRRVRAYEAEGMTRGDAQSCVEAEDLRAGEPATAPGGEAGPTMTDGSPCNCNLQHPGIRHYAPAPEPTGPKAGLRVADYESYGMTPVVDGEDGEVALFTSALEARAYVRAVNAHADLLAALRDCLEVCLSRGEALGLDNQGPVMDKARAALAKAKGGSR